MTWTVVDTEENLAAAYVTSAPTVSTDLISSIMPLIGMVLVLGMVVGIMRPMSKV